MSSTPNKSSHDDGNVSSSISNKVSGNHSHPPASKYPHNDQSVYSGIGKVSTAIRHDYNISYDPGHENRMPKLPPWSEARDTDRRSSLLPNTMFRVSTSNDAHSERGDSENRMKSRDSKDILKESMVENRDMRSESRELLQNAKYDKYDGRVDDNKDVKNEKYTSSEHRADTRLDKDAYYGSSSHLNWKDFKEQNRPKQYTDAPSGNVDTWPTLSHMSLHGLSDTMKEILTVDGRESRDGVEVHEAVGENKVDITMDDKLKDKDRKRKEVKHHDWGERDRDRNDRRINSQPSNSSSENKETVRVEREPDRWENEKKDYLKEKEKMSEKEKEKEKDHVMGEPWNGSEKEAPHCEKESADISGKPMAHDISSSDLMKDHDSWKNSDREAKDKKKERDADVESERPDKRNKFNDKEAEEGSMDAEVGTEREKEVFNCGVQQRRRMLRHRGSPQTGNRDQRFRSRANDDEEFNGKADMSCVVYKIGECMQKLVKLWQEYELSLADKSCESSHSGPTLEIRIPSEHVTATNRQVRGGQLWGTDIYTVDSDLVAVLMHTGYCRPTASPPPPAAQELRATIRVLRPQDCYVSTLRNNVRSRAWGAAVGCSYRVERCCIVKRGGGIIDLEPCLTHSSTMEPTLAPVAVERTMTTRAAASNALRQQRFVREVTIQYNLCMEPWLKYSISAVADKGLKKILFTSSRLKKGEVLYVETHSRRYELCFILEKVIKPTAAPYAAETGRIQPHNTNHCNGEKSVLDGESTSVDMFRWSRCKRPLPQKIMQNIGIPLPAEHLEVLEENLEWDDIAWSQTGVWIGGREYQLARAHFLSPV